MSRTLDDLRKQAKKYADDIDLEHLMDAIDFSKVDMKKLKNIDFSSGLESARAQLEQLPKVRVTTQPPQIVVKDEDNDGGFLPGLLLGVVLGAILALIFAPKSGQETRETIVHTVDDLKQKVAGTTDSVIEDVENSVDAARDDVSDALPDEPAIERNFGE